MAEPVVRVRGLRTQFGPQVVHDGLDLDIRAGEVLGVVGGSGTGKSVLLKEILGLVAPTAGTIELLGVDPESLSRTERAKLRARTGVLFQDGALFSSLTVAENVMVPLLEHTRIRGRRAETLARIKISMSGLPPDAGAKYPSELSGGMRKRAGLARALALDPDVLFLDEPTAGLDPIGAAAFDTLIADLRRGLGLTVCMVTHDLDSLVTICDRIAVLVDKRVRVGTLAELLEDPHPWIHEYFHGPRGRAARRDEG